MGCSLAILLPIFPHRIKEWAYAGLGLTTISAFISYWSVDGVTLALLPPLVFFGIITASYLTYHKIKGTRLKSSVDLTSGNTAIG